jgi:hypothetical protein
MAFLHGSTLRSAIVETLSGGRRDIAVAFIGNGAMSRLQITDASKIRLVCDLFSGFCEPEAIRDLYEAGAKIKNLRGLHAKVYLGDEAAIVGSANWSSNGLGDEGVKPQAWGHEAGMRVGSGADLRSIQKWFNRVFKDANDFDPKDIRLDDAWRNRPMRPSVDDDASALSLLRRAILYPDQLDGLGFVFTNTNNDKELLKEAKKKAANAHPELRKDLARGGPGYFTNWDSESIEKWPGTYLAYHLGPLGGYQIDAMRLVARSAEDGYVFARADWPSIAARFAPGVPKANVAAPDREVVARILQAHDGGISFATARQLSTWYREHFRIALLMPATTD